MKKMVYKCAECGSTDIEFRRWYNPNTGALGVDCEDEDCWCNHCEDHCPIECEEVEVPEPKTYFDGTKAIHFDINGYERTEPIYPDLVDADPDLENSWNYRISVGEFDHELTIILMGEYDEGKLSTNANLKVIDRYTDQEYYADYDIVNAETHEEDDDNWEWVSVLFNQASYDRTSIRVLPLAKDILDKSIDRKDNGKLKEVLRKKITDFLMMEIEDKEEFEELLDRLSVGAAAEYKGEDFWWEHIYMMRSL